MCRYDRTELTFRQLEGVQLVCAMGPPGGGRNPVTPRLLRHFNILCINEFTDATYQRIYTTILDWWYRRSNCVDEV